MKKAFLIIGALVLLLVAFLFYMGAFQKITFEEKAMGPFLLAYKEYRGNYGEAGPVFEEVYQTLLENGIETKLGLGIYYDDPKVTPPEDLRSKLGSIITEEQAAMIQEKNIAIEVMGIEQKMSLVTEFPIRNMMSYFIGPIKVYPAMEKRMNEMGYEFSTEAVEIYDMEKGVITFYAELKED